MAIDGRSRESRFIPSSDSPALNTDIAEKLLLGSGLGTLVGNVVPIIARYVCQVIGRTTGRPELPERLNVSAVEIKYSASYSAAEYSPMERAAETS